MNLDVTGPEAQDRLKNAFQRVQTHSLLLSDVQLDQEFANLGILPAVNIECQEPRIVFPMSYTLLMQMWELLDKHMEPQSNTDQAMARLYSMATKAEDKDAILWFDLTMRMPEALVYINIRDLTALKTDCQMYVNLFTITKFGTVEDLQIFRRYMVLRMENVSHDHMRVIAKMMHDTENTQPALRDPQRIRYWQRQFTPPYWDNTVNHIFEASHQQHRFLMLKSAYPVLLEFENEGYKLAIDKMQMILSMQTCNILHRTKFVMETQKKPVLTALSILMDQAGSDQEEASINAVLLHWHLLDRVREEVIQPDLYAELKAMKPQFPDPFA